jgi:hypothetical protein
MSEPTLSHLSQDRGLWGQLTWKLVNIKTNAELVAIEASKALTDLGTLWLDTQRQLAEAKAGRRTRATEPQVTLSGHEAQT